MSFNKTGAVVETSSIQQPTPLAANTRARRLSNTSNLNPANGLNINCGKKLSGDSGLSSSSNNGYQPVVTIDELITILKKDEADRSKEETKMLQEWSFLIPEAEARIRSRIRARLAKSVLKQRAVEQEESLESIQQKADFLAMLIKKAKYIVIYTGAGISTSASIPDYRGPNGLWTQIRKTGTFSITKIHDLSNATPTLTHMAIMELTRRRIVNHVVSQNCDGLHLRSGIPQSQLSEIHGNMYIEVCPTCEKQYYRQADITERTSRFRHKTGRKCHTCAEPNNNLIDTIVLYGERSRTQWPMNWERASKAAKRADLIICMGSSLKTLRRYNNLWPKRNYGPSTNNNRESPQTKLAIINLQYTSKDKNAVLKINGKCDLVMQLVMQRLNIDVPAYDWCNDPLQELAIPFTSEELTELKRNLIFKSAKVGQTSDLKDHSPDNGPIELSKSPSLFVSELTDDPDKRRLRMRIRAVNAQTSSSPDEEPSLSSSSGEGNGIMIDEPPSSLPIKMETEQQEKKPDISSSSAERIVDYALPGWLGKSLGSSRSSSYKRKRHGNKGRKHSSVLKPKQQLEEEEETEIVKDEEISEMPIVNNA